MRKVISLLVALTVAFAIGVTAFADVDGTLFAATTPAYPTTIGTSLNIHLEKNQMVLVEQPTSAKKFILAEQELRPGEEYTFKLYKASAAGTYYSGSLAGLTPVTAADLNKATLKMRSTKGTSAISSYKFTKKGSGDAAEYSLELNTKEYWGTKMTDVEYTITASGGNGNSLVDAVATFKVGWGRFTDDEIDEMEEGDIITITDDKTVILKKQFETLAKNYDYKAVEFEADDGGWRFTGRVSGMGDTNLTYTYDVIPSIINKFPEQDFKFLTFGAGVNLPINGEMRIDVSDVSGDFTKMYAYLYRNGKLTRVNTTYDTGADELVFKTNYLGAFVITNEEITDTNILEQNEPGETTEPTEPTQPAPTPGNNPNTGASDMLGLAIAVGFVSLAAAGATSRKK